MKLKFSKMHGLGNDFVIINNLITNYNLSEFQIQALASRKFGIGCDQVLLINPANDGASDFYYQIYNSDGSLAEQCGNGARCFIAYVIAHGLSRKKSLQLQTAKRVIRGGVLNDNRYWVAMGAPIWDPQQIPLNLNYQQIYQLPFNERQISFAALSMGNPHAVVQLADPSELQNDSYLASLAEYLQSCGIFPAGVNVNFSYLLDAHNLQLRTYERGCGFTLACGSGACASAVVAIRTGMAAAELNVQMPGGRLTINYSANEVLMSGTAVHVFDGEIEL